MKDVSIGVPAVATTKTTIYVVPANHFARWTLLYAHNTTSSSKWLTVIWYDKSSNQEIKILDQYPLPSKDYLRLDGQARVVLEEGDEIRLQAEATTTSCVVSVEVSQTNATQIGV